MQLEPAAARLFVNLILRALQTLAVGEQLARAVAVEVEMIDENFGEEAARPGRVEDFGAGQIRGLQLVEVRQPGAEAARSLRLREEEEQVGRALAARDLERADEFDRAVV